MIPRTIFVRVRGRGLVRVAVARRRRDLQGAIRRLHALKLPAGQISRTLDVPRRAVDRILARPADV